MRWYIESTKRTRIYTSKGDTGSQNSLMKNHAQEGNNATDRLLSRLADGNEIIRNNTTEWVLTIIAKLENQ